MKRAFSGTVLARAGVLARVGAVLASGGLIVVSGCLNPRPEELPSNTTIDIEPGVEEPLPPESGSPIDPNAGSPDSASPPRDPAIFPDEEDGGEVSDGGLFDAAAADAGAPVGPTEDPATE